MDLVSVIIPVRNAEPFLNECLQSLINQTYQDWELIVVNDHSSDKTPEILRSFEQLDTRIHVTQNLGKGIIDALVTGYSFAKGKLITRMDADDLMPLNKLQTMVDAVRDNSVVTGKVNYITETELGEGFKNYENWLNELVDSKALWSEIYKECVIPSPCWMMTRKTFERIGGFNSSVYPEDYDLVFRMYKHGLDVIGINETLHVWRDHQMRASRNDDHYSDNSFLELKLNYFLELDHDQTKELVIWGAGKKGKKAAQLLLNRNIKFSWITDNTEKIGKDIYGVTLTPSKDVLNDSGDYQIVMLVANPEEQNLIRSLLLERPKIQPFWFC